MNIQWYPGHMTKTIRMMQENINLVDIVIELLDSRVPYSSKNPDIDRLAANKRRIIVLNKIDLADAKITEQWASHFKKRQFEVLLTNSVSGNSVQQITEISRKLMQEKINRLKSKGRVFVPIRAMITGIPNVGKSTLINQYVGKTTAKTGDRPGVTKGKQWIRIKKDFELLDTPGILWPKFSDEEVGLRLAFTGAINDHILDSHTLALKLIEQLQILYPSAIKERYRIDIGAHDALSPSEILQEICRVRKFIQKGALLDEERGAIILLDEFRGGKFGRISLETPELLKK